MDLFDFLGFPKEKEEPKTTATKTKKAKISTTSKASKITEYTLPVTIIVPYSLPQTISAEEGKEKITEKELNNRYGSYLSWFIADEKRNILVGKINLDCAKAKGNTIGKEIRFGDVVISNDITDLSAISDKLKTDCELLTGCTFSFLDGDCIIPVITGCDICKAEEQQDLDNEDEKGMKLYIPGVGLFYCDSRADVTRTIDEQFSGLSAEFDVLDNGSNLIAHLKNCSSQKKTDSSGKYDISGKVTLSLVWTRFELAPQDFNGKAVVDKNDLCEYLIAHGYPEYTSDRTSFEYAVKDSKDVLIALLKSSSKGR